MSRLLLSVLLISSLYGEDIYNKTQSKCVPTSELIKLIRADNFTMFKKSIRSVCNFNYENQNDETLLFNAVRSDDKDIVDFLIAYGFDINHVNRQGRTVLYVAVKNKFADMVNLLMRNGLKDSRDNFGYFVKWYAYKYGALKSLNIINFYEQDRRDKKNDDLNKFIKHFNQNPIDEM